ncbi:hypothetical protein [Streptomyces jumonjinensis]|uniref:hypothetical protein n=1 Tax=Streptomyces jumonjinensis TaxID=1945 RepID=UPI003792C990
MYGRTGGRLPVVIALAVLAGRPVLVMVLALAGAGAPRLLATPRSGRPCAV